jgi:hypothetical protein
MCVANVTSKMTVKEPRLADSHLIHCSKLHRVVSFKVIVGVDTCIMDIIFEGISLVLFYKLFNVL